MKQSYIKYFIALILFGSNGIVANAIDLPSYKIVFMRALFGCALLFVVFWFKGGRLCEFKPAKDVIVVALSGAAMAADWLFLFEAYVQIGVSLAVILNYCGPIIVVALSPVLFHERITPGRMISLIAAMSGAILISVQVISGSLNVWGICCGILSAFSYAGMVMFNKKSNNIKGINNAMIQLMAALATVTIFAAMNHGLYIHVEAGDWFPVLWLGFVNTGVSCWLYFSSMGKLPVQTVAVCGYMEPLAAVLLAVVILGELMSPLQVLGGLLIFGGAVYGEYYGSNVTTKRTKYC